MKPLEPTPPFTVWERDSSHGRRRKENDIRGSSVQPAITTLKHYILPRKQLERCVPSSFVIAERIHCGLSRFVRRSLWLHLRLLPPVDRADGTSGREREMGVDPAIEMLLECHLSMADPHRRRSNLCVRCQWERESENAQGDAARSQWEGSDGRWKSSSWNGNGSGRRGTHSKE